MTQGLTPRLDTIVAGRTFVDETSKISVPNTTIIGRAKIPNIANDLKASLGIDRIPTRRIYKLHDERGPNGEYVWGVFGDVRGLIRFVGYGWVNQNDANGIFVFTNTVNDYIEIAAYCTDMNALLLPYSDARDARVTVDGGAEGSNIYSGSSTSPILQSRVYGANQIYSAVSGKTLGLHTIKIRCAAVQLGIYGYEVINSNSSGLININPGLARYEGKDYTLSTAKSVAYNTGVTGTKGGRIVRYVSADDTIGQVFTPVDVNSYRGNSADHTNEEVIEKTTPRTYGSSRNFGGTADDFSWTTSTELDLSFTREDGSTTLIGKSVWVTFTNDGSKDLADGVELRTDPNFIILTFIGTGLDIEVRDSAAGGSDTYYYSIDGGSQQAWFYTSGSTTKRIQKVVSGLPYGTHTFKFWRGSAARFTPVIWAFYIYGPKKPDLPLGAVEIADYNVMADYAIASGSGLETIGTGLLRKSCMREVSYVGSWVQNLPNSAFIGLAETESQTSGNYFQYTFFGTGFEYRAASSSNRSSNISVTLNGLAATSANFSNIVAGVFGTGVTYSGQTGSSFTPTTNTLDMNDGSVTDGSGLSIRGLPLGVYTVRFTNNSGSVYLPLETLDIITPIHVTKHHTYGCIQNTLPIGSCSMLDSREVYPSVKKRFFAQAFGYGSNPTATVNSRLDPMLDMSLFVKTEGNPIDVTFVGALNSSSPGSVEGYINVLIDGEWGQQFRMTYNGTFIWKGRFQVSPGTHKVGVYWRPSSGTITAVSNERYLIVEEIGDA